MRALFITLLAIGIWSCEVNDLDSIELSSDLIHKGSLYGAGDEGIEKQNTVITNSEDWEDLLRKMDSVNDVSSDFAETEIDFDTYQVIAVFEEVKNSGGYSIDLSIVETQEHILVKIKNTEPQGAAITVLTQPYYLTKVEKSNLTVIFE